MCLNQRRASLHPGICVVGGLACSTVRAADMWLPVHHKASFLGLQPFQKGQQVFACGADRMGAAAQSSGLDTPALVGQGSRIRAPPTPLFHAKMVKQELSEGSGVLGALLILPRKRGDETSWRWSVH